MNLKSIVAIAVFSAVSYTSNAQSATARPVSIKMTDKE